MMNRLIISKKGTLLKKHEKLSDDMYEEIVDEVKEDCRGRNV